MANIVLRLSTGSASTTATSPSSSTGGEMGTNSAAVITTTNINLNNLFSNISKSQNAAGAIDYRCVYIHNDTSDTQQTYQDLDFYQSGSSIAQFEFLIGQKGVVADTTPPSSGFVSATPSSPVPMATAGTPEATLGAGEFVSLWIKRTATNSTGSSSVTDALNLVVRGFE